jgi:hypothetical protein
MWVQLGMNLRERERRDGKGLWRSSVVFLALLLHTQHQRGRGESAFYQL